MVVTKENSAILWSPEYTPPRLTYFNGDLMIDEERYLGVQEPKVLLQHEVSLALVGDLTL